MKVSELIAELNKCDPNAMVIKNGHSDGDGYDEITDVDVFNVSEYNSRNWSGRYFVSEKSENTIHVVHIN